MTDHNEPLKILRWESPLDDYPIIVELRERREAILRGDIAGPEWGVLQENVTFHPMTGQPFLNEATFMCERASQVEVEGRGTTYYGRWLTDEEYTAKAMEEMEKSLEGGESEETSDSTSESS